MPEYINNIYDKYLQIDSGLDPYTHTHTFYNMVSVFLEIRQYVVTELSFLSILYIPS